MRVLLLTLVACEQEFNISPDLPEVGLSKAQPLESTVRTDRITQVTEPRVDSLWVIDNSCSMADEQAKLVENFDMFASYFVGSGLDYHVGVVSTDMVDPDQSGKLRTVAGQRWIDAATVDPLGLFGAMATLGTTGTGVESGLGAAYTALEVERTGYNDGFYRTEAALHTVTITDEKDYTDPTIITKPEFIDWYQGLKPAVPERSYSCIVALDGPGRGTAYLDAAAAIGGITYDIHAPDWPSILELLGIQSSGLKSEFFLSAQPVPGSVTVSVRLPNGIVLPFDEAVYDDKGLFVSGEWLYSESRNSVSFLDYVPEALSVVEITYELQAAVLSQE